MKNKTRHTPGPWWIEDGFSETKIQAKRKGKLANIVTGMYDEENEPTLDEVNANANLIAESPIVLRCAKRLLRKVNSYLDYISSGDLRAGKDGQITGT